MFGPLGRSRSLAVHEIDFTRTLTDAPVKVALPGPYLLTRIMGMEWQRANTEQDGGNPLPPSARRRPPRAHGLAI